MAQTGSISWPVVLQGSDGRPFVAACGSKLVFPPAFVSRSNGSAIFAAIEAGDPSLTFAALQDIAGSVKVLAYFVGSDLAPSCVRAKMEVALRASVHNRWALLSDQGVIVLFDGQCISHIVHREVESTFMVYDIITKLYAVAFCASLSNMAATVKAALHDVIREDLASGGFFPRLQNPSAGCGVLAMARMTILRNLDVRARQEDDHVNADQEDMLQAFLECFNGDHRRPQVQHFCHKENCRCGRSLDSCVQVMVEISWKLWFEDVGSDLPAQNRWYTFAPHVARQTGARMCHQLLRRVLERAFVPQPQQPDDDSHHSHCHKRLVTARDFVVDRSCPELLGFALLVTLPIDHMSLRLQHLDATDGGSVAELCDTSDKGIIASTHMKYWELCNVWAASAGSEYSRSLWWYLEAVADSTEEQFLDNLRRHCVGLSAAVWARIEIKYSNWPYRLMCEQYVRGSFTAASPCCLDSWCSGPLRMKLQTEDDLERPQIKKLIQELRRKYLKATNMRLEGLLGEMKASCRTHLNRQPNAERTVYTCHTRDLMKHHLARGGVDSRRHHDRSMMIRAGVPLVGSAPAGGPCSRHLRRQSLGDVLDCGDDEWPVSESAVRGFLDSHPAMSAKVLRNPGFANKARLARRFALDQGALLVEDASDIPVTHCMVNCAQHANSSSGALFSVSLGQNTLHRWDFTTLWAIGRGLFLSNVASVKVVISPLECLAGGGQPLPPQPGPQPGGPLQHIIGDSAGEESTDGEVHDGGGGDDAAAAAGDAGAPPQQPLAAPAAAAPAPAPPPPPRVQQGEKWPLQSTSSPWKIARIASRGVHVGWGATCKGHSNAEDTSKQVCKKAFHSTAGDAQLRMMAWLVEGIDIPADSAVGRSLHLNVNPRDFAAAALDENEMVSRALARWP
ncbi:unnamed protein product [Prorocentrum cordatum]|uniref:Ubiquitinyl hydrolase 1 n=1 Tax=Prorocentrum cordatum TaxID=2364126 RepID=A0ABN9X7K4_9DINO|nr:unnamed protein product [Polarella glacialis]